MNTAARGVLAIAATPLILSSALLLAYTPGWRKAAQLHDQPGYLCDDRF